MYHIFFPITEDTIPLHFDKSEKINMCNAKFLRVLLNRKSAQHI